MKQIHAVMAIVVGIAIFGGSITASGLVSNSLDGSTLSQEAGGLLGHVTLTVYDANGDVKKYLQQDNLITKEGEDCFANKVFGGTSTGCPAGTGVFNEIGIGLSGVAALVGNTSLGTSDTQGTATVSQVDAGAATTTTATTTLVKTFGSPGSQKIYTESGVLDDTSGTSVLLARQLFATPATVETTDTLTVTWVINVG